MLEDRKLIKIQVHQTYKKIYILTLLLQTKYKTQKHKRIIMNKLYRILQPKEHKIK